MNSHIDAAYAGLDRDTARIYRELSRLPVHDFDATLVAAVANTTPEKATGHLARLTATGLLESPDVREPLGPIYRFASPELRERVLGLARAVEVDGDADEVLGRALGWALAAAVAADDLITTSHHRTLNITPTDLPYAPQHPVHHPDADAALGWLTAQCENLLALVRHAAQASRHDYAWRLVYSLWPWWRAAGRDDEWNDLHSLALDSVRHDPHAGDLAERHLLNTYGLGLRNTGDPAALGIFTRVREAAVQAGDALGEAQSLHELGATHLQMNQPGPAVSYLEQARSIRAEHGYERGVALSDILLGQASLSLGHVDQALHRLQGARTALDGVDAHDAARALAWQARAQIQTGDISAAETNLYSAAQEFHAVRAPRWVALTVEWRGQAAEAGNRPSDAHALYTEALDQYLPISAADADRVRNHLARVNRILRHSSS
ncbi:tetratricopeptide repeat protein [Streptomyces sp. NPDC002746]